MRRHHRWRAAPFAALGLAGWLGCNAILGIEDAPGPTGRINGDGGPGPEQPSGPTIAFGKVGPIRVGRGYERRASIPIERLEAVDASSITATGSISGVGFHLLGVAVSAATKSILVHLKADADAGSDGGLRLTVKSPEVTTNLDVPVNVPASGAVDESLAWKGIVLPVNIEMLVHERSIFVMFTDPPASKLTVIKLMENGELDATFGEGGTIHTALDQDCPPRRIRLTAKYVNDGPHVGIGCAMQSRVVALSADGRKVTRHDLPGGLFDLSPIGDAGNVIVGIEDQAVTSFVDLDGGTIGPSLNPFNGAQLLPSDRGGVFIIEGRPYRFARTHPDLTIDETYAGTATNGSLPLTHETSLMVSVRLPDDEVALEVMYVDAGAADLRRISSTGDIRTDFGTDGVKTLPLVGEFGMIAADEQGRILFADRTGLHRFSSSGTPDPTFGTAGVADVPLLDSGIFPSFPLRMAIDEDGRILVLLLGLNTNISRHWP